MGGMHKTGQTALQQSETISEQTHMSAADDAIQENPLQLPIFTNSLWKDQA